MREVLKCYGDREVLETRLKLYKPELDAYQLFGKYMDTIIIFEDIGEDDYDDVLEILDEFIYNDEEVALAQTLVSFLRRNDLMIATAESCTGGLVASKIIEVPNASEVFYEGLVTYSNYSKINRLGVMDVTLEQFGAVSQETALEMANALLSNNVDIGVATTGIAGPGGGTLDKPVGLVYIGIATKNSCDIIKKVFDNQQRNYIRECATNTALFYVLQHIKKYY